MANAIKEISIQRGYDVTQYTLACFGGAGEGGARIHLRGASAGRVNHPVGQRRGEHRGVVAAAAIGHDDFDAAGAQRLQRFKHVHDAGSLVQARNDDRQRGGHA